ncbi:MAG: 30S ribosomal protein S15 [Halobacteriovoraceae bacterium]|nr:30S ribosomal protein S15 [Halobacteriovoraceae bacterium]
MITKEQKAELAQKFGKSATDTGSAEVQVAILTARINDLSGHFSNNKHDYHSNRGLMKMIGRRKALLKYVQNDSHERYAKLIQELGLRK